MNIYYLYLDETKANDYFPYFCLAGCIIKKDIYEKQIVPEINKIKKTIFNTENIILHEIDIRRANKEPYKIMRIKEKRYLFWSMMNKLFKKTNLFYTIGAAVNPNKIKTLYQEMNNNEYYIALQIILENFTHFLELNEALEVIFIESRNPTEDQRMSNHFHNLKANGTLFLNKNILQNRLTTISFPLKSDNIIGLQLADFIPNPIARCCAGKKQKNPSLYKHIKNKCYDGNRELESRFGIKIIP